ncbi:MAG: FtsX-like permease family protein, partial [Myxococcales bacterium]|nr:FtsX-like permease family protein [Myxococcales bacterium]
GIRLAIGARESQVLAQFLVEAATLSTVGGIVGIVIGLLLAFAVAGFLGVPFIVDPLVILMAFGFSALVGVGFGYFPARGAARLDPIAPLAPGRRARERPAERVVEHEREVRPGAVAAERVEEAHPAHPDAPPRRHAGRERPLLGELAHVELMEERPAARAAAGARRARERRHERRPGLGRGAALREADERRRRRLDRGDLRVGAHAPEPGGERVVPGEPARGGGERLAPVAPGRLGRGLLGGLVGVDPGRPGEERRVRAEGLLHGLRRVGRGGLGLRELRLRGRVIAAVEAHARARRGERDLVDAEALGLRQERERGHQVLVHGTARGAAGAGGLVEEARVPEARVRRVDREAAEARDGRAGDVEVLLPVGRRDGGVRAREGLEHQHLSDRPGVLLHVLVEPRGELDRRRGVGEEQRGGGVVGALVDVEGAEDVAERGLPALPQVVGDGRLDVQEEVDDVVAGEVARREARGGGEEGAVHVGDLLELLRPLRREPLPGAVEVAQAVAELVAEDDREEALVVEVAVAQELEERVRHVEARGAGRRAHRGVGRERRAGDARGRGDDGELRREEARRVERAVQPVEDGLRGLDERVGRRRGRQGEAGGAGGAAEVEGAGPARRRGDGEEGGDGERQGDGGAAAAHGGGVSV